MRQTHPTATATTTKFTRDTSRMILDMDDKVPTPGRTMLLPTIATASDVHWNLRDPGTYPNGIFSLYRRITIGPVVIAPFGNSWMRWRAWKIGRTKAALIYAQYKLSGSQFEDQDEGQESETHEN